MVFNATPVAFDVYGEELFSVAIVHLEVIVQHFCVYLSATEFLAPSLAHPHVLTTIVSIFHHLFSNLNY